MRKSYIAIIIIILLTATSKRSIAATPDTLYKQAMIAFYQGKIDRALPLFNRALASDVSPDQRALIYLTRGEILRRKALFKQSKQSLLAAKELLTSRNWENHPLISVCDRELIQTLLSLGSYSEAEKLARKVLERDLKSYGESDKTVLEDRIFLSKCLLEEGLFQQSKEVCQRIIQVAKTAKSRPILEIRLRLAELHARLHETESAIKVMNETRALMKSIPQPLMLQMSSSAMEIATALRAAGDNARAQAWLFSAIGYRDMSGETHNSPLHRYMLIMYLAQLMSLQHEMGLTRESKTTAHRFAAELSGFKNSYPDGGGFKGMFPEDWTRLSHQILRR